MAHIIGSKKEALLNETKRLVSGGPLGAFDDLKKRIRQYRIMGETNIDLVKHIVTNCDKAALPTLVVLLEKNLVISRIEAHYMHFYVKLWYLHLSISVGLAHRFCPMSQNWVLNLES